MTILKIKLEYLIFFTKLPGRVQGSQYVTHGKYLYGYLSVPGIINSTYKIKKGLSTNVVLFSSLKKIWLLLYLGISLFF